MFQFQLFEIYNTKFCLTRLEHFKGPYEKNEIVTWLVKDKNSERTKIANLFGPTVRFECEMVVFEGKNRREIFFF